MIVAAQYADGALAMMWGVLLYGLSLSTKCCNATQLRGPLQVVEYIKVEDFEGADAAALQGPDGRARCEALRLTSHMLQANRSQEGTIVTVKDLINLPREVHHLFTSFCKWSVCHVNQQGSMFGCRCKPIGNMYFATTKVSEQ